MKLYFAFFDILSVFLGFYGIFSYFNTLHSVFRKFDKISFNLLREKRCIFLFLKSIMDLTILTDKYDAGYLSKS